MQNILIISENFQFNQSVASRQRASVICDKRLAD